MELQSNYLNQFALSEEPATDNLHALQATLAYLTKSNFVNPALHDARLGKRGNVEDFQFEPVGVNYCDFCMSPLMGGEYDRLADGRDRCLRCTETVVRTKEEFADLFMYTKRQMSLAFDITLNVSMQVRMVNAKEIAKKSGETFSPTPGFDGRVLGYASYGSDGYTLNVENGSPALALVSTVAHEMTHIWQYLNWDEVEIMDIYGEDNRLIVYEGMSSWAETQYLYAIKEYEYAARMKAYYQQAEDEYGDGFRMYCEKYPLREDGVMNRETPFHSRWPL